MEESPVVASARPTAVDCTMFSTQVVREPKGGGLAIGSGGPNPQFASRAQEPAEPPQFPSVVQAGCELLFTQWVAGPAPWRQSSKPEPALPVRFEPSSPSTSRTNDSTLSSSVDAVTPVLHGRAA